MHDEAAGRPEHQHMLVIGTEEGLDGDDAVAARLVFDNDRLPPFDLQLFGEQPCAHIGASAGAERYDELHDPRRPVLRLLRPRRPRPRRSTTEKTDKFTPPHGPSVVHTVE